MSTEMIGPKELARRCGVPMGTVYWWISTKRVPFVRLGRRQVRFEVDAIERWIESRRQVPASTSTGT